MESAQFDLLPRYKVAVLGDPGVGKTSIINQFIHGIFHVTQNPTIGIDYLSKIVNLEGRSLRLQIWDTAGQERFRALIPSYIRNAEAVVVVFDVTNRESFANVRIWLDLVKEQKGDNVTIMIAGNKSDLNDLRVITFDEQEQEYRHSKISHVETSAKQSTNISAMFRTIATAMPVKETSESHQQSSIVIEKKDPNNEKSNSSCAC